MDNMSTTNKSIEQQFSEHLAELLAISDKIEIDARFDDHIKDLMDRADKQYKKKYYQEYYNKKKAK